MDMAINFKTLKSFVSAIDARSVSAAAQQLDLSQSALSQHIASLEEHFQHKLLNRSNAGVSPTRAGTELYRHAHLILRHLEQAELGLAGHSGLHAVSGPVSVGLATYSTASALYLPLLQAVRRELPDVSLFINDNFGLTLSEMVMTGRMDMAVIYSGSAMKGLRLQPLLTEDLFLIAPGSISLPPGDTIPLQAVANVGLLLPGRAHFLRRMIDDELARIGVSPRITAEIDSADTLRQAMGAGLGATILPAATAQASLTAHSLQLRRIVQPDLRATISLCVTDHLPMSDQARAVLQVLQQQVDALIASRGITIGIREPEVAPRPA